MSLDLNPLSKFASHTVYHILVAFKMSIDAYNFDFTSDVGNVGDIVRTGCGNGIVLLNEMKDSTIVMKSSQSEWSFFGPNNFRTTSYGGFMEVSDRSGFYFTNMLKKFIDQMDTSLYHLTFGWVPVFIGVRANTDETETIFSAPLFFHVTKFTQNVSALDARSYVLDFVSCYNSHGTSPQFSMIQQNTVTHKDGNTINTAPVAVAASGGLVPTMIEDAQKLSPRKNRLDKTKYMKTFDDFCKSFEVTLNQQKKQHKKQLQEYMAMIRDDYSRKIDKLASSSELPIDYHIKTDGHYSSKKLDNRNLPFEQYEVDQNIVGISSVTFPLSYNLQNCISQVLRMSKDVGREHTQVPAISYKITTSTRRECDNKYHVYTKVNKYISPLNTDFSVNTGPGNNLVLGKPIEYTYQDKEANDNTVISITFGHAPHFNLLPVEKVSDSEDTQAVYGDREMLVSMRKTPNAEFFQYAFSGINGVRGAHTDNGLQNSEHASGISDFSPSQQTLYTINVLGNPNLFSDINRNPNDVIDDVEGNALIYSMTEYEPIYIKLKVYLAGDRRQQGGVGADEVYYYDGFLHVYKIMNIFTPGMFNQIIYCSRTNERE